MAQTSLNIYLTDETLDNLKDVLKGEIANIQQNAVSEAIKNREGSGNAEGGSITYKRFKNAALANKGAARTAGAGTALRDANVVINLSDDKEIVEELQMKDVKLFGIDNLIAKRSANHVARIVAYLDRTFFATAKTAGTAYDGEQTEAKKVIDELIVAAKSTSSDYIEGIDAMDLAIVLDPAWRKALKNDLDALPQGTVASNGAIGMYDGIEVFESVRLPQKTHAFVMMKGSVAQPYLISEYDVEKVPFDDAVAVEHFLYAGCGALNPEAIYYFEDETSL